MLKIARIGVLATLLASTMAAPVMAEEETVAVTTVRLDRTAKLTSSVAATVRLTGTIACNAEGPADLTTTIARQRAVEGRDNWDLYMFACSTEPRPFTVVVESPGCDPDFAASQCFKRGVMRVEVVDANGQRITAARVVAQEQRTARVSGR